MKGPSSRMFAFVSGFLIGVLSILGFQFLLINDFNPISLINSSLSDVAKDTIIDNRKTRLKEKQIKPADKGLISEPAKSSEFEEDSSFNEDEIVVVRDELVKTIDLELVPIEPNLKVEMRDSLLEELQGGKVKSKTYVLEFWNSPVNFQGYQVFTNRIKVFGLSSNQKSELLKFQEKLYLKNGSEIYELTQHDDFEPFVKVNNEQLIKRLNQ